MLISSTSRLGTLEDHENSHHIHIFTQKQICGCWHVLTSTSRFRLAASFEHKCLQYNMCQSMFAWYSVISVRIICTQIHFPATPISPTSAMILCLCIQSALRPGSKVSDDLLVVELGFEPE